MYSVFEGTSIIPWPHTLWLSFKRTVVVLTLTSHVMYGRKRERFCGANTRTYTSSAD